MNCDDVRESISAALDGESGPVPATDVDAHLLTCAGCRAWNAAVRNLPVAGRQPARGLTEQVLRAVSADLSAAGDLRRQDLSLRAGLVVVSLVQLVLAVPVLIFGHDHSAPMHVAHELGSFDAAVALGLIAAARRPRLAPGMLPLVAAITALLMTTAGSDLAAGRTDVLDEAPHLLDLVGFLLLRRLSVIGGPSGPPALLVPISSAPRPLAGGGGQLSAVARRWLRRSATRWEHGLGTALRRVAVVTGVMVLTVGGLAVPASAHVVHDGDDPTNWRSAVTSVMPAVPGLTVAIAEAGQRIGLTNRTGSDVVVIGFYGEAFLRFDGDEVSANELSSTAHTVIPGLPGTALDDPTAAADWHVVAHGSTWWWHDPRTHYDGSTAPAQIASRSGTFAHYQNWQIGLRTTAGSSTVHGTLDWVPGNSQLRAWLLGGLLLLLCTAIGWLKRWSKPLVVALVAVTVADVVHAASATSARVGSLGNHLAALPGHGLLIAAVWVTAVVAAVYAWRGRIAAAYLGLLAAGITVMVDALPSAGVLWRSQAVTTLGHDQAALLVAGIIGAGAGTSIGCLALMLRLDPAPRRGLDQRPAAETAPDDVTDALDALDAADATDAAGTGPAAEDLGCASLTSG